MFVLLGLENSFDKNGSVALMLIFRAYVGKVH